LTVVDDASNGCAVIEHDVKYLGSGIDRWRRPVSPITLTGRSAARDFNTSRSIARKPRIFRRICTLAWLSNSSTGLAKSRKKWLAQSRCGTPANSLAIVVTNAPCLSDIHTTLWTIQSFGPVTRMHDYGPDFTRGARQKRLGKPHALATQFSHDIERFVPLFRLQAIDRKHQPTHFPIFLSQQNRVLLTGRQHALVALQIVGDRVFGQDNSVAVQQLGAELRN
jgi:hypothetical protein